MHAHRSLSKQSGALDIRWIGNDYDIHVQFIQTYDGVEGDSASVSIATAVISAVEDIPIDQTVALTGSLNVRGDVMPIGGATARSGIRGTNFTLLFIGFISMWSLSFLE